jgi:hypothetical protein
MPEIHEISNSNTKPAIHGEGNKFEGVRGSSHDSQAGVVGVNDWAPKEAGSGGNGGWFESSQGEGVRGWAKTPFHGGVVGVNTAKGIGVFGESDGAGVQGHSTKDGFGVVGESAQGGGVHGLSHSAHGGVVGVNDWAPKEAGSGGNGGWFESSQGEGVRGWAKTPFHGGVVGVNTAKGVGVFGTSDGEGIHGETTSNDFVAGVTGVAVSQDGIAPGVLGQSNGSGPGVVGKANKDAGVIGFHGDPRLQETTVADDGSKAGVFGASENGAGVLGYSRGDDPNSPAVYAFGGFRALALGKPLAGWFQGNVQVDGDIFLPGADCAEQFDIGDAELVEAGAVVVIDQQGALRQSQEAYDRKVAGVVSGAGDFTPGIVLNKRQSQDNRLPIALVGKVYCKVDAQYGPIEVGDLLTTSATPGHAMKVLDHLKAFGAVIGKALRPWRDGSGLIPILVCLQ